MPWRFAVWPMYPPVTYLTPGSGRVKHALGPPAFVAAVPLERLRQQASPSRAVLEDVDEADGGVGALDARLDQPELLGPLGLGPADVARRRSALRIGILVMPDQGLPMLVPRPLHGFADLAPGDPCGPGHRAPPPVLAASLPDALIVRGRSTQPDPLGA